MTRGRPRKEPDEFAGVTLKDCCGTCVPARCVIVEDAFCGHPYKGTHPTGTPRQKERIARVAKIIAHQRIER